MSTPWLMSWNSAVAPTRPRQRAPAITPVNRPKGDDIESDRRLIDEWGVEVGIIVAPRADTRPMLNGPTLFLHRLPPRARREAGTQTTNAHVHSAY